MTSVCFFGRAIYSLATASVWICICAARSVRARELFTRIIRVSVKRTLTSAYCSCYFVLFSCYFFLVIYLWTKRFDKRLIDLLFGGKINQHASVFCNHHQHLSSTRQHSSYMPPLLLPGEFVDLRLRFPVMLERRWRRAATENTFFGVFSQLQDMFSSTNNAAVFVA